MPKLIYLYLPALIWIVPYIVRAYDSDLYKEVFRGEFGITENLTILFLFIAVIIGGLSFFKSLKSQIKILPAWIILITLGCLYFGGEEASWGQHFLGWGTPDFWQGVNDQGETNLHNTSGLFDQIPRLILTAGALVGGVLIPLLILISKKTNKLEGFRKAFTESNSVWHWIFPTIVCLPSAFIAVFINEINYLIRIITYNLPFMEKLTIKVGESKEEFLALFLMIYISSIYVRLNSNK